MPRVSALVLAAALALAATAAAARPGGDLVSYSFDDGRTETGPESFVVFEHAKGRVDLDNTFFVTAPASVVIEDVPGDGEFPEIQGYFPLFEDKKLYIQFYLMPTQTDEEFNVALCGRAWFTVQPEGIAFWLIFRGGRVYHVSNWTRKLLLPRFDPFQWYRFDVVYDIDHGTYDVSVTQGERRLVALRRQPNAPGSPGSGVYVFSFIGDLADRGRAKYYLDSLNIGRNDFLHAAPSDPERPMLWTPARRSLVDQEVELLRTELDALRGFHPLRRASDAPTFNQAYIEALDTHLLHDPVRALQLLHALLPKATSDQERAFVWNAMGLAQLGAGNLDDATRNFTEAARLLPALPEPQLNLVLTAARAKEWSRALGLAKAHAWELRDDNRLALLQAKIWLALDRHPEAATELAALDLRDDPGLAGYRLLLRELGLAKSVSDFDIESLLEAHPESRQLGELVGDLFFVRGDYRRALDRYLALAEPAGGAEKSVLIKTADCAERLGDADLARRVREEVYGRL
jgi:tetratricopeptide (TPR) repeat protein